MMGSTTNDRASEEAHADGGTGDAGVDDAGVDDAGTVDTDGERRNDADEEESVVLVVDDEKRVTQAFALWLDGYEVRRATSGEAALEALDDDVDVVLLDRQMPGLSGGEVLERIRDRGYDCRVAMVTGVDPDFEIVDMPFDDYLTKPVDEDQVRRTVEELLRLSAYGEQVHDLFALANKQASLAERKSDDELADSEEYERLLDDLAETQADLDAVMAQLEPAEYERLFRDLPETDVDLDA